MLVIRLARGGRHKYPTYRIVAAESARAATGKFVEILGHYNPHTKELSIKKDETEARLKNGAQPSNTVIKLLQQEKIELPKWAQLKTKDKKPKKEPIVAEAAEKPAETEKADEAKTEETPENTSTKETPTEEIPAKEEVRVAEAATDNAAEVAEKAPDRDDTETAEITEQAAEAAEATEDAGVEPAAAEADSTSK